MIIKLFCKHKNEDLINYCKGYIPGRYNATFKCKRCGRIRKAINI